MNAYPMTMIELQAITAMRYFVEAHNRRLPYAELLAAKLRWQWACLRLGELGVFRAVGVPYRVRYADDMQAEELDEVCT